MALRCERAHRYNNSSYNDSTITTTVRSLSLLVVIALERATILSRRPAKQQKKPKSINGIEQL